MITGYITKSFFRCHLRVVLYGAVVAQLFGCAPALQSDRPVFPFAANWSSIKAIGSPRLLDNAFWWKDFKDAPLDQLVSLALMENSTLAAARARSASAAAARGSVPGALSISGGGAAIASLPFNGAAGSIATEADLSVLLLLDPGRSREAERALAGARAAQAEAQAKAARLLMIARVTETYIELRLSQTQLSLAEAEAVRQGQTRDLAAVLETSGEGTRTESLRSRARLAALEGELPRLRAAVAARVAELGVLAGYAPGSLPPNLNAALEARAPQPRISLAPDPGIPADLIRNRPDIRAAEAGYDAARAELSQARATLWPRLSLSGTIEIGSSKIGGLSFGPALRLPILPTEATQATIVARDAKVAEAYHEWRATVLAALLEVETALLDYRAAVTTELATERAARLYREVLALTRSSVESGEATIAELILAEDSLGRAEDARAQARATRARSYARLNLRLGAGGN